MLICQIYNFNATKTLIFLLNLYLILLVGVKRVNLVNDFSKIKIFVTCLTNPLITICEVSVVARITDVQHNYHIKPRELLSQRHLPVEYILFQNGTWHS